MTTPGWQITERESQLSVEGFTDATKSGGLKWSPFPGGWRASYLGEPLLVSGDRLYFLNSGDLIADRETTAPLIEAILAQQAEV